MSLCLFLMTEDSVYIGSDSAITIDGKRSMYSLKKINQLNDGKLLFIAGTVEASMKINKELAQYDEISIEMVQELLRAKLQSELKADADLRKRFDEGKDVISAFLFTPAREVYLLAAQSNFEATVIDSQVEAGTIKVHAAGYDAGKAYDEAVRLVTSGRGLTPTYIINKAFEHVSGAQVGGYLTITRIDSRGVHMSEPRMINEILRFELTDQPLVSSAHAIASEVIGGVIRGANISTNQGAYPYCEMSADNNIFKAAKSPTSYIEIVANPASGASPIIQHVDDGLLAVTGSQAGSYFSLVAGGNYNISAQDGTLRLSGKNIIFNADTMSGIPQSAVTGLPGAINTLNLMYQSLDARVAALE